VPRGVALRARVTDGAGALLRVMSNAGTVVYGPIPVVTPVFEFRFTLPLGANWARAEVALADARDLRSGFESACRAVGTLGEAGLPEDTHTTYCRNQLAVLAMSSALYLE